MTSTSFFDAPGGIRKEGNSQTLTFTRVSATTGTVCWAPTPPSPSVGCGTPSGHYSGGVLIGSTSPISQLNKPKDGVCCYTGDPTFDELAFAGDTLGNARVLWSSNTDIQTGCITVDGLDSNCQAYYFAFFAIDNVCRYNQDGIYSYSLNLTGPAIPCVSGSQTILTNGARLTDSLPPLDPLVNFPITMIVDGSRLDLTLRGSSLTTFQSVVDELSVAWKYTSPAISSQFPPRYGQFFFDGTRWFQHNGIRYVDVYPIVQPTDPSVVAVGDLWFDTTELVLKERTNSGWIEVSPVITFASDPTIVQVHQHWFDGFTARVFDGNVWIDSPYYNSPMDPLTPAVMTGTSVWKQASDFYKWSITRSKWLPTTVLVFDGDTDIINNGTLWFNPIDSILRLWNGIDWVAQPATVSTIQPTSPSINQIWIDPTSKQSKKYDALNSVWVDIAAVFYHKPLNDESAGDIHYIPSTGVLRTYDGLTSAWLIITNTLYDQQQDPTTTPTVTDGSVWFNAETQMWFVRSGVEWDGISVIQSIGDPRLITSGFWYNTATQLWYERNGAAWTSLTPVTYSTDPTSPNLGTTWFDGTELKQRTSATDWSVVPFVTTRDEAALGDRWLTDAGDLMVWSGKDWIQITAPYTVSITAANNILVSSVSCGGDSYIDITAGDFFVNTLKFVLCTPAVGNDGTSGIPMYDEIGVGTDGSVDERRRIIDNLYTRLGAPTINVELTREQMDLAVQKGLDYMRRDSGAGYDRGYFFLDLQPGQQKYVLTSKAVGFNKIVDIMYLYRPRGGFLNSTYGGEIYGQQLIQQLYVSGTFDILSYHLLAQYQSVVSKLFASEFQFQWSERTRTLMIHRKIARVERILVDAVIEKTEQDLFTDRMTKNWIENWALTEAKIMLGDMRGKFTSLPGAGGSVAMNADVLKAEAVAMQDKLMKELDDYNASDIETWGLGSSIAKG